jgi:hypothetical protein
MELIIYWIAFSFVAGPFFGSFIEAGEREE